LEISRNAIEPFGSFQISISIIGVLIGELPSPISRELNIVHY
jgi:hypothetical protein